MKNKDYAKKFPSRLYVPGRNATRECLISGAAIEVYCLARLVNDPLCKLAVTNGVKVTGKDEKTLSSLARGDNHQGFVTLAEVPEPLALDTLISQAKNTCKNPLIVILDGIEDPHNFGAILRSADGLGVQGVVIKSHGGSPFTPTVAKASTGALFYTPIAVVTNLRQACQKLKDSGFWLVASDGSAKDDYSSFDVNRPLGLIIGSEGDGISRLVLEEADYVVKIPMQGHVSCLNASVAASILFAHIAFLRSSTR